MEVFLKSFLFLFSFLQPFIQIGDVFGCICDKKKPLVQGLLVDFYPKNVTVLLITL